ncbi:EthD domain-containing protein [Pseudomonas saliphila]|uniref:EthD domain-containing protein n=1 Tax=Pseudomonas saliphila TaxID=2586906 RepID=UPI0012384DC8|nr:EthD domain-containing protein [Pseudomonas saliphila]
MKAVSLLVRKPEITRAAFRDYYEHQHCTLAMQHFPFQRYVRNHLVGGDDRFGFDCISEFGMADDFRGVNLMGSRSRQMLEADEREFMRPELIRVAAAEEHVLFEAARHGPSLRRHVLLFCHEGRDQQVLREKIEKLGVELAQHLDSVSQITMDILSSDPAQPFPFDALLWIQTENLGGLPPQVNAVPGWAGALEVATCASSEDELRKRFVAFQP